MYQHQKERNIQKKHYCRQPKAKPIHQLLILVPRNQRYNWRQSHQKVWSFRWIYPFWDSPMG